MDSLCYVADRIVSVHPSTTGARVNPFKSAAACLLVVVICGCDHWPPADFAATKKAAERGDAVAQCKLGAMYDRRVPRDYPEAVKWYRLAAHQGLAARRTLLMGGAARRVLVT